MQCKAGGTSCHSHQLGLSGARSLAPAARAPGVLATRMLCSTGPRPSEHLLPCRRVIFVRWQTYFLCPDLSCLHVATVHRCLQHKITTVHDRLLHPHLRHCSSPASAVRRLPSAVRTATPAFHVRSSGLFCGRPGGLEFVTRLPA